MSSLRKYGPGVAITQSVITVLCLLTARLCFALESPSECSDEPKYIVLDYDDLSAYSITHGICKDGATCECLPGDPHSITKAYIYDGNGMEYDLSVSDDQHHFDVVLSKLNQPLPGIHTYSFGYEYECPYINYDMPCHKGRSKEMNLTIKIVDYKLLRVNGSSSVATNTSREQNSITHREKFGSVVTLLCSSSQTGANDSALDIPVEFVFNSKSGTNKSGRCMKSKSVTVEDNWIIYRQNFPPYECTLTIIGFSSKDTGEYQCAGLLPREDNSQYKKDRSKVTITLLSNDLPPTKPPKTELKYLALISIGAVLLLIPGFLLYKKYRRQSQQGHRPNLAHASSTTSLVSHRSLHQNYGTAISSLESTLNRQTVGNEGEIESNVSQHAVQIFVEEPNIGGRSGRTLSQSIHQSQEGTHTSTISAGTEGRQYYEQYTDIQHADGRQTPENSDAPPNENYKCHHCGKVYHDDQRLFYTRHVKECQQRCPNYNGEAAAMNPTNKNTLDTNDVRLPDNLTIGTHEGAARSRGSTMSEIKEGKGYYNDYCGMEVPEDAPTPEETGVPLDNNFTCPDCGKTYHENHRLYFKRHIDELRTRCPKYESMMAAKDRPPSSKSSSDLDSY